MADLSINKNDVTGLFEDMGSSLLKNSDFEQAPSFTAAATTTSRWIDGTAAGSATNDIYKWFYISATSQPAQFDTAQFNSGTTSMKLSLGTTNTAIIVTNTIAVSSLATFQYAIPINASTAYKLTYWMKTNLTSGSSRGAWIRLGQYNSSGASVANNDGAFVATTTSWTQYTVSFTSNSTAAYCNIQLNLSGTQAPSTLLMDAWFDDIVFQQTNSPNTPQVTIGAIVTPGIQNISGPKIWS